MSLNFHIKCLCFSDRCVFDAEPECSKQSCPAPAPVRFGSTVCTNESNFGSKCQTQCEEGYLPTTKAPMKCKLIEVK